MSGGGGGGGSNVHDINEKAEREKVGQLGSVLLEEYPTKSLPKADEREEEGDTGRRKGTVR